MNIYTCKQCQKSFNRSLRNDYHNRHQRSKGAFCSKSCFYKYQQKGKTLTCKQCHKDIYKKQTEIKKNQTGNFFCSRSCSVTYHNLNKSFGTKVSKLEKYIQSKLTKKYPKLKIYFNQKDIINSELDIYIPSLKLAFELNGIFHYEPIFGKEKLSQIKNNDQRKFQACLEKNIELCIIDVSQQKYFKEKTSNKYLDIIEKIIESKLQRSYQ